MVEASLKNRLALASCAVAGLAGLLVGLPLHHATRGLLERSLQDRAAAAAETISVALEGFPLGPDRRDALVGRLRDLAEESDLDLVTLSGADWRLVASTDSSLAVGARDPLLVEADVSLSRLETEDAAITPLREDAFGRASVLAVAPLEDSDPPLFVAVRAPASWSSALDRLSVHVAEAVLGWMLVAGLLGAILARRVLRPLDHLAAAARSLTEGPSAEPLPRAGVPELDALAEDFDRMRLAVERRERWLRGLAGAVAHEVRNPAHALRLQLGLLQRSLPDAPLTADRFTSLLGELDQLEATVSSLLAFAEGAPAVRSPTPLLPLLRQAGPGAQVDAPDVVVEIDPILVGRAVGNLVRNARQAGASTVTIRAEVDDEWLTIRVSDDGRGFEPALAARAVEPFARGEGGGSGLGLALVAAVAEAHGGHTTIADPGPDPTVVETRLRLR